MVVRFEFFFSFKILFICCYIARFEETEFGLDNDLDNKNFDKTVFVSLW